MRRFMLTNKPGFDLKEAVENPSFEKSVIQVIDNDGTILDEIQWTPVTDYMYSPKPTPSYMRPHKIKMETGEIQIPPIIPENTVTSGENPFIQIIYRFTNKQERKFEDIYRHLTQEKKVLSDNKKSIYFIEFLIDEMFEGDELGGLLIARGDSYITGVKLKIGRTIIPLHAGYDPFEYAIMNYSEKKGTVSRDELHELLSMSGNRYKWARYDKTIEYYINKLLKQKNIKKFGKDWYRYIKYPERMT